MARVFIGIGSNVGDRQGYIHLALRLLAELPGTELVKVSNVYETPPLGPVAQGLFLNAAVELRSSLSPVGLLQALQNIEKQAGREPLDRRQTWGPRTLDLDLLFYDDLMMNEGGLTLPHPRLHERWFVLTPLADLDPGFVHPVLEMNVRELLIQLAREQA